MQTRSPQGNFRAFGETLFGRKADALVREAVLEPGARECTAIVLMPSFVPYCDFDVRTNWYQLDRPTHSDISMKETLKLSRKITCMRNSRAKCSKCTSVYRDARLIACCGESNNLSGSCHCNRIELRFRTKIRLVDSSCSIMVCPTLDLN